MSGRRGASGRAARRARAGAAGVAVWAGVRALRTTRHALQQRLWIGVIKQLLWSVLDAGFTRIAAVKGCGGHWALPGALWDVKADARRAGRAVTLRMLAVDADWCAIQEELFPGADGGHAAVMETALCLAERARLVRLDAMRAPRLADFRARYVDGGDLPVRRDDRHRRAGRPWAGHERGRRSGLAAADGTFRGAAQADRGAGSGTGAAVSAYTRKHANAARRTNVARRRGELTWLRCP